MAMWLDDLGEVEKKVTAAKKGEELGIRMLDYSKVDDRNYGEGRGSDPHVDITCDSTDQVADREVT